MPCGWGMMRLITFASRKEKMCMTLKELFILLSDGLNRRLKRRHYCKKCPNNNRLRLFHPNHKVICMCLKKRWRTPFEGGL